VLGLERDDIAEGQYCRAASEDASGRKSRCKLKASIGGSVVVKKPRPGLGN